MPQTEDDYWQNLDVAKQVIHREPWLAVKQILDINPFGPQIGAWPKQNVPEALHEALFGPIYLPHATEPPPLKTYAILDAAKVPLLPDLLEKSGLSFRCIFKGDAFYELSAVAPYVAELHPDADFTRQLFSDTGGSALLWHSNCAAYLRSEQNLENVVRHLRKIYRIKGTAGKPDTYLRFWAPETLRMLQPILVTSYEHAAGFFANIIASIMWRRPNRTSFTQLAAREPFKSTAGITLNARLERRFISASISQRAMRLQLDAEAEIAENDPVAVRAMRQVPEIRRLCHAFRIDRLGIRSHHTAAALLSVIYSTGINILQEPSFHYATRNPFLSPEAKARQLLLAYVMIAKMSKEG